jgi:chloramphenicol-sensitive protein RarD
VAAFSIWGFFPLYFKMLDHIAPVEVVAWRCVWSFVALAVVISVLKRWDHFFACFRSWKKFSRLVLSMTMIVANWGVFVYAVSTEQVLQSSLAYFINPLVSVLLGVVFLHERLRRMQVLSVALATVGVLIMTFLAGGFPSIAIILAFSFAAYGYIRKTVKGVDSLTGLGVEVSMAIVPAILLLAVFKPQGRIPGMEAVSTLSAMDHLLLILMGTITMLPLLLFITAARRLPLSMIGILQFITPTLHFLLAVFAFRESFPWQSLISFSFIWLAVTLFLIDSRRPRPTPPV